MRSRSFSIYKLTDVAELINPVLLKGPIIATDDNLIDAVNGIFSLNQPSAASTGPNDHGLLMSQIATFRLCSQYAVKYIQDLNHHQVFGVIGLYLRVLITFHKWRNS